MTIRIPDQAIVYGENKKVLSSESLSFKLENNILVPEITGGEEPLCYVVLRWNLAGEELWNEPVKVMGDAWERGYGDLEWRGISPDRCMPWYFLVSNGSDQNRDFTGRRTQGFGVKVRPSALCFWQYDGKHVTLYLDIRNGAKGVLLGGRTLSMAQIVFYEERDNSAFRSGKNFLKQLCTDGIFPKKPVFGSNNWYYAYGTSSETEILDDTRRLMERCQGLEGIPYMVIDDCWQPNRVDGPWDRGNEKFPDMKALAGKIKDMGAIPGIWVRYLIQKAPIQPDLPADWRMPRERDSLDPSHPEVLDYVETTTKRIVDWGYKLIKHDFSTFDIFGKWGFQCPTTMATGDWCFHDRTLTSAEIILNFYRRVRAAAGPDTLIIGCNTIGHLCAGLVEINRTGDDTSGREWFRTRKMGSNTLAFRALHNGIFYMADADCVGLTPYVPWHLNKKWLRALASSGSPLFVSWDPKADNEEIRAEIDAAFARNQYQTDVQEPVDWMETLYPCEWLVNGEPVTFDWSEDVPVDPLMMSF